MIINERTGQVIINEKEHNLTRTEIKVLAALKENQSTYEQIYYRLYKIKVNELSKTEREGIAAIISRIRRKTNLDIQNNYSYGYKLGGTNGKI